MPVIVDLSVDSRSPVDTQRRPGPHYRNVLAKRRLPRQGTTHGLTCRVDVEKRAPRVFCATEAEVSALR